MVLLPLERGFLVPRSEMGVASEPYSIKEDDTSITLSIPVPGLRQGDVSVKVLNDVRLSVRSKVYTRFTPRFNFSFSMPDNVERDDIMANIEDGILNVILLKKK
jgi:HSP20 family molecular chaperone IbpA